MALIKCKECGRDVSSNAAACPNCGNPISNVIESRAAGATLTTTQATSKKFKGQQVLATLVIGLGVVFMVSGNPTAMMFGAAIGFAGLIWYLVARAQAWWHHG